MVLHRLFRTVDKILWKKISTFRQFLKKYFLLYFEHSRNSIESEIHELKNIKSFSSLDYGPKSDQCASAF